MIKHLVSHGNSKALVIDKALLQAAGLSDKVAFQVTIHPHGITIQSVCYEEATPEEFRRAADEILTSKNELFKRLADQWLNIYPLKWY